MINIGIIGAGRIADLHAPGYLEHPEAQIVAVADNYDGLAQKRAEEWRSPKAYTDYRRLLHDDSVDAVEILTPHSSHLEMMLAAIDAGKHVSVQKPMAISLAECDRIVDAADRTDRIVRVFENFRYYAPLAEAKRMLDDGVIGAPLSLRMKTIMGPASEGWQVSERTKAWRFDDEVSGGGRVTLDYGWHIFAMARILMGPPHEVFARIGSSVNADGRVMDVPLSISWSCVDGGRQASWEAHASQEMVIKSDYYAEDEWFELTGSKGFIWVNRCTGKLLHDTAPLVIHVDGETTRIGVDQIDADWGASFKRGTQELVDSIRDGRKPGLSVQEGREIYRSIRAAQLSARENRPVSPAEVSE